MPPVITPPTAGLRLRSFRPVPISTEEERAAAYRAQEASRAAFCSSFEAALAGSDAARAALGVKWAPLIPDRFPSEPDEEECDDAAFIGSL